MKGDGDCVAFAHFGCGLYHLLPVHPDTTLRNEPRREAARFDDAGEKQPLINALAAGLRQSQDFLAIRRARSSLKTAKGESGEGWRSGGR